MRLSAHATGLGKALLASLSDEEVRRRFGKKPLARMTQNTITSVGALVKELARIRASGFAIDNEEYTPGLFCLAVPIYDHAGQAVVAISTSVPTHAALARDPDGAASRSSARPVSRPPNASEGSTAMPGSKPCKRCPPQGRPSLIAA